MKAMEFDLYAHGVAIRGDEILATYHDINAFGEHYGLPAVYIRPGEKIREALELAMLELTGLYASVGRLLMAKEGLPEPYGSQYELPHLIGLAFECEIDSNERPTITDFQSLIDGSITGSGWIKIDVFKQELPRPSWHGTFYQQALRVALGEMQTDFYDGESPK